MTLTGKQRIVYLKTRGLLGGGGEGGKGNRQHQPKGQFVSFTQIRRAFEKEKSKDEERLKKLKNMSSQTTRQFDLPRSRAERNGRRGGLRGKEKGGGSELLSVTEVP